MCECFDVVSCKPVRLGTKMFLNYDKLSRVLLCGCLSGLLTLVLDILGHCSFHVALPIIWLLSAGTYLALASIKVSICNLVSVLLSDCCLLLTLNPRVAGCSCSLVWEGVR